MFVVRSEAVKKWDWLRATTDISQRFTIAARCLSQFFHSLSANRTMVDGANTPLISANTSIFAAK